MDSNSNSDAYENSTIAFAVKPPIKTPVCHSVNQVEILQNLGNYKIVSQFEADGFIQKIISLLKKPDATKINCLPATWRDKFECLSLDSNDFLYMDERLVIPKLLRPIILRSLHYGHPACDSMLATVSNVWRPCLHRELVGIAQTCQQCKTAGKNIRTILRQSQGRKIPTCTEKKARKND